MDWYMRREEQWIRIGSVRKCWLSEKVSIVPCFLGKDTHSREVNINNLQHIWKKFDRGKWVFSILALNLPDRGIMKSLKTEIQLRDWLRNKNMTLDSVISGDNWSWLMYNCSTVVYWLLNIYTKKKVKHPHVFLKWQMIQVSSDYWPDNLKNAMVTC
jgi:hypothetical protein